MSLLPMKIEDGGVLAPSRSAHDTHKPRTPVTNRLPRRVQGGFFGKERFCRDSHMSSLEHKGTAFDASGGRVPPASHGRPKGVARVLRARGIVRSRIQRVFVVPNRSALQKNPLCTLPRCLLTPKTDAYTVLCRVGVGNECVWLQHVGRFGAICSFGFGFIIKHDLADRAWVRQWLTFRKEQAVERAQLFEKLEETTF